MPRKLPEVRGERTAWRDDRLPPLHQQRGYELPAPGVHSLFLEYDRGKCVFLVDFIEDGTQVVGNCNPVVTEFCDRDSIPFLIVATSDDMLRCVVQPQNGAAKSFISGNTTMNELEMIELFFALRGRDLEKDPQFSDVIRPELAPRPDGAQISLKQLSLGISSKHRHWGWNCPGVDIDFLVVNKESVRGLVEYKHQSYSTANVPRPTWSAFVHLADRTSIGAFKTIYSGDYTAFKVYGWNEGGKTMLAHMGYSSRPALMDADEWFSFVGAV